MPCSRDLSGNNGADGEGRDSLSQVSQREVLTPRQTAIAQAAGPLFHRAGFHDVTMSQISAEIGMTAPALYRYVRGKHEILSLAIHICLAQAEDVAAASASFDEMIQVLARVSVQNRHFGALWRRESRHLQTSDRQVFEARVRGLFQRCIGWLPVSANEGPEVRLVRALSIFAVIGSPSVHNARLPEDAFVALLSRLATLLATVSLAEVDAAPSSGEATVGVQKSLADGRISRRERLLSVAADVFAEHGFRATTMEEIGGRVGITGPSIYGHFDDKSSLLHAVLLRGDEWLHADLSRILELGSSGRSLAALVRSYARFALQQPALLDVLIADAQHLLAPQHQLIRQRQRTYVREWTQLLRSTAPGLTEVEARCVVHATLMVINELALARPIRGREEMEDVLVCAANAVLLESSDAPVALDADSTS